MWSCAAALLLLLLLPLPLRQAGQIQDGIVDIVRCVALSPVVCGGIDCHRLEYKITECRG
jgi:hypothetical protein